MGTVWTGADPVWLSIPTWPSGDDSHAGEGRAIWAIETISDVPSDRLELLGAENLRECSTVMSFEARVENSRRIDITCTYPADLEGPFKLASASRAWRYVDENVARIWKIGDFPRASFPEFMRQRREVVGGISSELRKTWLWLALTRSEPFLRWRIRQQSRINSFTDLLQPGPSVDAGRVVVVELLKSDLDALMSHSSTTLDRLMLAAVRSAAESLTSGSVDMMCYCTERLFDILLVLEKEVLSASRANVAMVEDVTWYEDAKGLIADDGISAFVLSKTCGISSKAAEIAAE